VGWGGEGRAGEGKEGGEREEEGQKGIRSGLATPQGKILSTPLLNILNIAGVDIGYITI